MGRVVTGKTPPTARKELFGEDFPFITPTDIRDFDTRYLFSTERGLSSKGSQYQRRYLLPRNAVCYVCIGSTIGKICLTARESFTNQQINSLIVDRKCFDPMYVFYLLRFITPQIQTISGGSGSGKAILNKSSFEQIEAKVHALPIQRKIAAILSAYDDLIENNTRRIKILEEMAEMMYCEWFVNFRFPGHENVRMVDSEMGMIPEGWKVEKLSDGCHIIMGQSPKSEFYNTMGEGLPFHQGVTDFGERFPVDRVYCTVHNRIAERGDILFSVRAPVGRFNIANKKIVIGRGLCAIRSNNNCQYFVFHQLKELFREEDTMGGGTVFKAVTKEDIHGIKILMPDGNTIKRFEEIAQPIGSEVETLTDKNTNLRRTRDLLLPKLISGEIDVENLDMDTEVLGNG